MQKNDRRVPDHDPLCIECKSTPKLVDGQRIYPHRPDLFHKRFYLCECGAYVGCHPESTIAMGNPCGERTRRARNQAHNEIDPIWRGKQMSRNQVYKELARRLGISRHICHVAHMDEETAHKAAEIGRQMQAELKKG